MSQVQFVKRRKSRKNADPYQCSQPQRGSLNTCVTLWFLEKKEKGNIQFLCLRYVLSGPGWDCVHICATRVFAAPWAWDSRYGPRFSAAHANVNNEDDDCEDDDINSKCTNDLLYIRYLAQLLIGLRKLRYTFKSKCQITTHKNFKHSFDFF